MNKPLLFILINLYSLLIYMAHSAPTIFFPRLADARGLNTMLVGLFFSAFPIGAFPASLFIGKLMRFERKDSLLLFFHVCLNVSRLLIGVLTYIEDAQWFFLAGFFFRLMNGIAQGCLIPILYSLIPDFFPEEMMVKFGVLEISGSIGVIIGGIFTSFLYEEYGYFAVFAITSLITLVLGGAILLLGPKSQNMTVFRLGEEKSSLSIKQALFQNVPVLWDCLYLVMIFFPGYMILPGYELYITSLSNNVYLASTVYTVIFMGMIFGVLVISYLYAEQLRGRVLFLCGLTLIIALLFYGPDPLFGFTDIDAQISLIALAFLATGVTMEVVFLIMSKTLIQDLKNTFPGEEEGLCADFANGLLTACLSLDHLIGPLVGGMLNLCLGYASTGGIFSLLVLLPFFIAYWAVRNYLERKDHSIMGEEPEGNEV